MSTAKKDHLPPNVFAIGFGLAGLSGTWSAMCDVGGITPLAADAMWLVTLVTWVTLLARYFARAGRLTAIAADLKDPVLAPFLALVFTTWMLLADRLNQRVAGAGTALGIASVVAAAVFGAVFTAMLLSKPRPLAAVHSGYLLPTVASGLIAAQVLGHLGLPVAAMGALAVGLLFWLLIGALLVVRQATERPLPDRLVPTIAIFSAPPAVAGNAWFALANDVPPQLATLGHSLLLGPFVLLVLLQIGLIPCYAQLPFTLGFWSFTFTAAASATYAIRLLHEVDPPGFLAYAWALTAGATALIGAIAVRSAADAIRSSQAPTHIASPTLEKETTP